MRLRKIVLIETGSSGTHVYSRTPIPRLGSVLLGTMLAAGGHDVRVYIEDIAPLDWSDVLSADLVGNPNNLKIETHVNGELRQSWNTNDFICNTQQMIAYISKYLTLEPGDIIFTGTPHGVILGYPKDKQVWLKAGDEIVSTIEKLGELTFTLT